MSLEGSAHEDPSRAVSSSVLESKAGWGEEEAKSPPSTALGCQDREAGAQARGLACWVGARASPASLPQ